MDGTLVKHGDGTYELDWNSMEVWQFNSNGNLVSDTDRSKNVVTYAYNGGNNLTTITDTQGRTTSFTRTGGYVTTMTDNAGSRSFGYAYDASNRLKTYTDASLRARKCPVRERGDAGASLDPARGGARRPHGGVVHRDAWRRHVGASDSGDAHVSLGHPAIRSRDHQLRSSRTSPVATPAMRLEPLPHSPSVS
jgi:YD repeat-containing protein